MESTTWIWIILAVLVLAAVVALIARSSRTRQAQTRRTEAAQLREEGVEHERALREREAAAAEADARARQAEAVADQQAAQAERLRIEAERGDEARAHAQERRDEHFRRADALDPDVPTDRDGYRLDEHGKRIEPPLQDPARGDVTDAGRESPTREPIRYDDAGHPEVDRPHGRRQDPGRED